MSARSYCVGLPVIITVKDDGSVAYEIDTSEAGAAVADAWYDGWVDPELEEAQCLADSQAVSEDHDRRHSS